MKKNVVVVGSINVDLTIRSKRLPRPGETIIGGGFTTGPGGKGANQAVAAVRAGANVRFIARVGRDVYGQDMVKHLGAEGVCTDHILQDEECPTGMAFILVDEHGENSIVVASGANARLCPQDISRVKEEIGSARVLLVQLECHLDAVHHAIEIASASQTLVIVNPAPAQRLDGAWFRGVDVITPNKIEAEMLASSKITDRASLVDAARRIMQFEIPTVIITLGRQGVFLATEEEMTLIPAYAVTAVDSTGAGDVFSGSLAAFLAEGLSMDRAVRKAIASSSVSVTRMGAQAAAPTRSEIDDFMEAHTPLMQTQTENEFTLDPSPSL